MTRPLAFEKNHRLSKGTEFGVVLKRGFSVRRPPIQLFILKKRVVPSRLGIWVSKREFRKAVDRNRVRRWVREFFRKRRAVLIFPCDLIIQVARGNEFKDHGLFETVLEKIFQEVGLLKA